MKFPLCGWKADYKRWSGVKHCHNRLSSIDFYLTTMIHAYCIMLLLQLLSPTGASESGIVNGKISKPHSRPYMASLQFKKRHACGGILIREDFVLTAAHCGKPKTMTVVLGAHNIKKKEKSQQRIKVAKYIKHPKFDGKFDNDIMLLKLKKKAKLNKFVETIGLPEENGEIPDKIKCTVAGWGRTAHDEPASDVLKENTEKLKINSECRQIWGTVFDDDSMICTEFTTESGGVCQGDSGGPLICNNKLQGITAFTDGQDCNDPTYPHVFTKVNTFVPWIKEVLKGKRNVA